MTKTYQKNKIKVLAPTHMYLSNDFFEGEINEIIERLQNFVPNHQEFIKNLKSENGHRKDPMWDLIDKYVFNFEYYHDGFDLYVSYFRDETDEELEKRIEADKKRSASAKSAATKRKKLKEKEERELYEKLKKKYE